jgi:glycosidase
MPSFEFHVSRRAREAYGLEAPLFGLTGNVVLADFPAARAFAARINAGRPPGQAIRAGQINALGLIDELQHLVLRAYRQRVKAGVMGEALTWLSGEIGEAAVDTALLRFVEEFPPAAVYRRVLSPAAYLAADTEGLSNRDIALEEMLMLRLANLNPAFAPFKELFDDATLAAETAYMTIMDGLREFFAGQPPIGPARLSLIDFLRAPALAAPDSLAGQLDFIRAAWSALLGDAVLRALRGLDFIREEERAAYSGAGPAQGPVLGPGAQAASLSLFGPLVEGAAVGREPDFEYERFSPDLDWMPNLVLIAKNAYVWLDQLSKQFGRAIRGLDQIPDEELDRLRNAGITGLWLIGLWERSRASQRIKQMMGNPEAVASAYSLFDYEIAGDLGGEAALQDLKARAMRRGVRLASDMVPNHMGIDSRWVIEHPEWFLSLDAPPFPAYDFTGPDLSWDARVGIQIENRYFDRADAAVVFKRTDRWTGDARYIYHGNDGTSFPWNDTAQLDFLKAEVREAVIRTILHVARLVPVIRFDAAMTLAKRHIQRLWFPEPGTGGAIPSRSERGLTREQFDAAMPHEFWREVVDRVAAEAPDTLLLAEAFWLMEGYFVRTLGMHRVYNSAFMNMLRDEDNAKYRQVLKNTLEFDPEVLKRYVNFMSNPDEKTAIEQFSDGDKYFGVCTLLATLPGLPMVGHGQVEGFAEKYGMEYRRAYHDEAPKPWLVDRHARQIFPLFHKRRLFAGVEHFLLYDAFRKNGRVDENVFAYSNKEGGGEGAARALVVYHNKYKETAVWIRASAAYAVKNGARGSGAGVAGDEKTLVRKELRDGLGLPDDPAAWVVFKDQISGLEFLRNARELCERGLHLELKAYECRVFMDFRIVRAGGGEGPGGEIWAKLAEYLQGGGVPNIDEAARDFTARPAREPFRELVNAGFFTWLLGKRVTEPDGRLDAAAGEQAAEKAGNVARGVMILAGLEETDCSGDAQEAVSSVVRRDFEAILQLPVVGSRFPGAGARGYGAAVRYLLSGLAEGAPAWTWLFCWAGLRALGSTSRIAEWRLGPIIAATGRDMGLAAAAAEGTVGSLLALAPYRSWHEAGKTRRDTVRRIAETMFAEGDVQRALGVNEYQGVRYFNKEAFESLIWLLMAIAAVDITADSGRPVAEVPATLRSAFRAIRLLQDAEARSGYDFDKLVDELT